MADEKQKKPWYKKWWAITLFIIIGLAIIGNLFGGNNSSVPSSNSDIKTSSGDFCHSILPERINLQYWKNENGDEIWSYYGSKFGPLVNQTPKYNDGTPIQPDVHLWFQKGRRTRENVNYLYLSRYLEYKKTSVSSDGTLGEEINYRIMIVLDPNDNTSKGYKIKYYKCCQSTKYNPCDIRSTSYKNW